MRWSRFMMAAAICGAAWCWSERGSSWVAMPLEGVQPTALARSEPSTATLRASAWTASPGDFGREEARKPILLQNTKKALQDAAFASLEVQAVTEAPERAPDRLQQGLARRLGWDLEDPRLLELARWMRAKQRSESAALAHEYDTLRQRATHFNRIADANRLALLERMLPHELDRLEGFVFFRRMDPTGGQMQSVDRHGEPIERLASHLQEPED